VANVNVAIRSPGPRYGGTSAYGSSCVHAIGAAGEMSDRAVLPAANPRRAGVRWVFCILRGSHRAVVVRSSFCSRRVAWAQEKRVVHSRAGAWECFEVEGGEVWKSSVDVRALGERKPRLGEDGDSRPITCMVGGLRPSAAAACGQA